MIRYEIKAGKLTESGLVDTFLQLTNRLKQFSEHQEYSLTATQEDEQNAGQLQNDKKRVAKYDSIISKEVSPALERAKLRKKAR